jgi:hypothetical protein
LSVSFKDFSITKSTASFGDAGINALSGANTINVENVFINFTADAVVNACVYLDGTFTRVNITNSVFKNNRTLGEGRCFQFTNGEAMDIRVTNCDFEAIGGNVFNSCLIGSADSSVSQIYHFNSCRWLGNTVGLTLRNNIEAYFNQCILRPLNINWDGSTALATYNTRINLSQCTRPADPNSFFRVNQYNTSIANLYINTDGCDLPHTNQSSLAKITGELNVYIKSTDNLSDIPWLSESNTQPTTLTALVEYPMTNRTLSSLSGILYLTGTLVQTNDAGLVRWNGNAWIPQATIAKALTDTVITAPANRDVVMYDSTDAKFKNQAIRLVSASVIYVEHYDSYSSQFPFRGNNQVPIQNAVTALTGGGTIYICASSTGKTFTFSDTVLIENQNIQLEFIGIGNPTITSSATTLFHTKNSASGSTRVIKFDSLTMTINPGGAYCLTATTYSVGVYNKAIYFTNVTLTSDHTCLFFPATNNIMATLFWFSGCTISAYEFMTNSSNVAIYNELSMIDTKYTVLSFFRPSPLAATNFTNCIISSSFGTQNIRITNGCALSAINSTLPSLIVEIGAYANQSNTIKLADCTIGTSGNNALRTITEETFTARTTTTILLADNCKFEPSSINFVVEGTYAHTWVLTYKITNAITDVTAFVTGGSNYAQVTSDSFIEYPMPPRLFNQLLLNNYPFGTQVLTSDRGLVRQTATSQTTPPTWVRIGSDLVIPSGQICFAPAGSTEYTLTTTLTSLTITGTLVLTTTTGHFTFGVNSSTLAIKYTGEIAQSITLTIAQSVRGLTSDRLGKFAFYKGATPILVSDSTFYQTLIPGVSHSSMFTRVIPVVQNDIIYVYGAINTGTLAATVDNVSLSAIGSVLTPS